MSWTPTFIGMQLIGVALAVSPTFDTIGAGLQGYLSATLIMYSIAARRIGGWWA